MPQWVVGLACVVALGCGCSPYGGGSFACTTDMQCGTDGKCAEGFCSFPDPNCSSGYRYGDLSGPQSNSCVGAPSTSDGGVDTTMPPLEAGVSCYGMGLTQPCFSSPPVGSKTLSASFNTDSSTMCETIASGGTGFCVISGQSITITGNVVVTGGKPLVLVATGTISVQGALDLSSHRSPTIVGAGANPTTCGAGTAPNTSGGGAGGTFGGKGGNGGGTNFSGTNGGLAAATAAPAALRGGCAGQNGNGATPGARGAGGGAVYLIAETSITVTSSGSILAEGAGGGGGTDTASGGGGGGSGGYIGLDSPTIMNGGVIAANAGGGGEGSGATTAGSPGNEPIGATGAGTSADSTTNGGQGGAGASGGTLMGANGQNGSATGGGGGGGGGAGIIKRYRATSIGGAGPISPPAT
ncbi:MAG TPA: hypothetical protein VLB44_00935 [Kofleriaceae bacterium]|nr:hypothetical protein [Kofleriaceae bacterium]